MIDNIFDLKKLKIELYLDRLTVGFHYRIKWKMMSSLLQSRNMFKFARSLLYSHVPVAVIMAVNFTQIWVCNIL